jgi:effector-binding domain-containing protein
MAPSARQKEVYAVMYEVKVVQLQPQHAAVIRFQCAPGDVPRHLGPAYGEIGGYLHKLELEHEDAKVYARFLSLGPTMDVEAGFTVAGPIQASGRVTPGQLPGGEAATTLHVGPYEGLAAATEAVRSWIAANRREAAGGPWEVYVDDPEEVPASELKTEVYVPLKPR